MTDLERIQAVLAGRTYLFDHFVESYGDRVYRLICSVVADDDRAADITQEVFVKAFTKLESYSGVSPFGSWLYRIAWNAAISETRTAAYRLEHVPADDERVWDNTADNDAPAPDDLLDGDTSRLAMLDRAIEALPPDDRALVTLFYLEENSVKTVAEATGLSEANVKVRLHRIRKKLYLTITDYEKSLG